MGKLKTKLGLTQQPQTVMINIALSGETGADPVRARRRKARSESIDKQG